MHTPGTRFGIAFASHAGSTLFASMWHDATFTHEPTGTDRNATLRISPPKDTPTKAKSFLLFKVYTELGDCIVK